MGASAITSVLRGEASEQVASRGHNGLSVFGLLNAMPAVEVRNCIDQLTQGGFLERVGDRYPTLQITGRAPTSCADASSACSTGSRARGHPRQATPPKSSLTSPDAAIRTASRAAPALARARGVPPYVVFHDATLRGELASRRPTRLSALLEIPGIGRAEGGN